MNKINWKIRIKNPVLWLQILVSIGMTALAYNSIQPQELTTWGGVIGLIAGVLQNPYLIGLCLWNAWSTINDPTTSGVTDSTQALEYTEPNKE